jgi:2-oxoglutarate ferredoxin oxidoreductase subunit alpha
VKANDVYLPHAFGDPAEVPALSDFGGEHVARYTTSTHGKDAYLTTNPQLIQEMVEHFHAKIDGAADKIAMVREDFEEGAEILVISYGIISRSASVAIREARSKGVKVSSLVLQTLWPVPEKAIKSALRGVKRVIVPEMNMGQYRIEIERLAPKEIEIVGVNKMDTTLVSPQEIIEKGGLL